LGAGVVVFPFGLGSLRPGSIGILVVECWQLDIDTERRLEVSIALCDCGDIDEFHHRVGFSFRDDAVGTCAFATLASRAMLVALSIVHQFGPGVSRIYLLHQAYLFLSPSTAIAFHMPESDHCTRC